MDARLDSHVTKPATVSALIASAPPSICTIVTTENVEPSSSRSHASSPSTGSSSALATVTKSSGLSAMRGDRG